MSDKISVSQGILTVGETQIPTQDIVYIGTTVHALRRFIIGAIIAGVLFALTMSTIFGFVAWSLIAHTADSSFMGSAIGWVFGGGMLLSFAVFEFATLAYPLEWHIEVVTRLRSYTVHVERSRMRANIYVNRLRRQIGLTA